MPNETVLIVDDDPELLKLTKDSLAKAGYRVLTSADGAGARQVARDERPDAIILSFDLPVTGGIDICRTLKNDNNLRHIPVVFVDEDPSVEDKVSAFDAGCHDFVTHPVDREELAARIGAAIRAKQTYDRLRSKNARLEALAKHVRAAVQHYEQPRPLGSLSLTDVYDEEGSEADGKAIIRLTRRELEILQLLARGLNNEVISRQLYISPTTTRNHIQNILGKLGVHSKLEAVAYAVRAGYVDFVG